MMKDKLLWQSPENCRLATVEIIYRLPDHPHLLQTFVWQEYDYVPDWPILQKFLSFWESNLEGKLHSVNIASTRLVADFEWTSIHAMYELH